MRRWIWRAVLGCGIGGFIAAGLLATPHGTLAAACDTSWTGGNADWSQTIHWTNGVPTSTANACLPAGAYTVSIAGESAQAANLTIGAGVTLSLQITGCGAVSAVLTMAGNLTNAGTLALENPTDACGGTARIIIPSGATLTNTGTILTSGGRGDRQLTGSVINQGTINVNHTTGGVLHLDGAGVFDSQGAVTIADGMMLRVPGGTGLEFRNNAGGSVAGNGATGQLILDGGNTFTEGAGTTTGNAILLTGGGTLQFTGAGASTFNLRGDGGANTLSGGMIAAGQTVNVQIHGCSVVSSVANLAGNLTNAGTINLGNLDDGCGGTAQLVIPASATLTNTGTILTSGGRGDRQLTGSVTNQGTINLNPITWGVLRLDGAGLFDNQGAVTIADGQVLRVPGGTGLEFRNSAGGSIAGNGSSGQLIIDSGNTFTEGAGTTTGNAILFTGGGRLSFTGAGASTFNLRGDTGANTLSGAAIAAGQTVNVQIHGCGVVSSIANLAGNLTNAGTINLGNLDDGCGGTAQLVIPASATLTNTGTILTSGGRGDRQLTGSVTNRGTINVNPTSGTALHLDGAGLFDNFGSVTVAGGMTLVNTNDQLIAEPGGTLGGAGSYTLGSAATLGVTIDATHNSYTGISCGGSTGVAGSLKVRTVGAPTPGTSWPIIVCGSRVGQFASQDFAGRNYAVQYPPTGVTLVAQVSCDVWIGGVDTNFGTAANWSLGIVPTSTDDACITATTTTTPPANADTYSVVVSGSPSVHSLTLGGPNGAQTLLITASSAQLSLGAASAINANGVLVLGDAGTGNSTLCCAGVTLTNAGHLNTIGATGTRFLRVNIANAGTGKVDIAAKNTLQDNGTTTTNNGTVTVEASGGLGLSNISSFINAGGSVTNNGAFSLNGSRFTQRGGSESGVPVYFYNGSTLDDDLGAGVAGFTLEEAATLTGTGLNPGVATGQVVTLASGNQTGLGVSLTNAGTIALGDAASGLTVLGGPGNLTNTGHLNTIQGGGGTRYLRVNVMNASAGTIDVAATSSFQDSNTTTTNNGTVTIEASGGLGLFNIASFINAGGSVNNNGAFSLNGSRFTQRGGTESGTPVYFDNGSTLDDDVAGGAGLFTFLNSTDTLTGTGPTPGIGAGQVVTIAAGNGTQATLGVNLTNAGTIVMGDAGAGYSILCCAPNTLTNTGHLNTIQGGGGTRYLRVNLTNSPSGTIDVAAQSTFQDSASGATTTTNNGTVTVEASGGFGVFGHGSFINGGGSVTNNGAFSMNGSAVFIQRAGSESGTPVYLFNGSTLDDDVGGGAGLFTFLNSTATLTGTGPSPGIGPGQVVTIGAGNGTQVTLGANITNAGTIVMGDAGAGSSTLCCGPNILTNTGHLNTIQGGGGLRYIRTNLINAAGGIVDIGGPTLQDMSGLTSTNNGMLSIEPGRTFSLSTGASFTQRAGGTFQTTVDANATKFGSLTGGTVNLDGQLKVTTVGSPAVGSTWPIISGANRSGQFATRDLDGSNYDVTYPATGVTLVARPLARPYRALPPKRILDTRQPSQIGPYSTPFGPNESRDVMVLGQGGVPASGVSAVVLNVTVTDTTSGSYLTIYPTGVGKPLASNLNWVAGKTIPNLVEVALGTGGQVSVYNAFGTVDVIFDVAGYVSAPGVTNVPDGLFNPVVPFRLLDTRFGTGAAQAPVGGNQTIDVQVTGVAGSNVPLTGVSGVVLNVTVTNPTSGSYLTVFPTGDSRPLASNLNFTAGQTVPNRVIVKVAIGGKVSFYNAFGSVDVIADIGGWFTDSTLGGTGSTFTGITPTRIYDTRTPPLVPVGPNSTIAVPVAGMPGIPAMSSPTPPTAVVLNVTVTNPTAGSYLTVWPSGAGKPLASDLNCVARQTVPNLVVVQIGADGTISVYNAFGTTDVVIDVVGYYS